MPLSLFPYQKKILKRLLTCTKGDYPHILAADPGLGKTAIALHFIAHYLRTDPSLNILVVAPKSAQLSWREETKKWDIFFFNQENYSLVTYHGMVKNLEKWRNRHFIIIFDESHALKNRRAKRSKVALILAHKAFKLLCLTGTPTPNTVLDIHHQIVLNPHQRLGVYTNFYHFAFSICGFRRGAHQAFTPSTGWNFSLYEATIKPYILRIIQDDVFVLPPIKLIPVIVSPTIEDIKIFDNFETELTLIQMDLTSSSGEVNWKKLELWMTYQTHFRALLGEAKTRLLGEWIVKHHENKKGSLIVFFYHICVVEKLKEMTTPIGIISGKISLKKRKIAIDAFRECKNYTLFVQINAGSESLNLQAGHNILFAEYPWTPGALVQAMRRVYRVNQRVNVKIYFSIVDHSLDRRILKILSLKSPQLKILLQQLTCKNVLTLRASQAEFFMRCSGWAELLKKNKLPAKKETGLMRQGTLVHQIVEDHLTKGKELDFSSVLYEKAKTGKYYVNFLKKLKEKTGCIFTFEHKIKLEWQDLCITGTVDTYGLTSKNVYVIEFKTGRFLLDINTNHQLLMYALGMFKQYSDHQITIFLVQPLHTTPIQKRTFKKNDPILLGQGDKFIYEHLKNPIFKINTYCKYCDFKSLCPNFS